MHGGQRRGAGSSLRPPDSGLLRRRRGPRGGRTQGCEQHGPPQDEVPLRREGRGSGPVVAVGPAALGRAARKASSRPLWACFLTVPGWAILRPCGHGAHTQGSASSQPQPRPDPWRAHPLSQHPQVPGPWASGLLWQRRPGPSSAPARPRAPGPEHWHPNTPAQSRLLLDWGTPPTPPSKPPCSSETCHPISSLTALAPAQPRPRPLHWTLVPAAPGGARTPSPPASVLTLPLPGCPTRGPGRTTSSEPATH